MAESELHGQADRKHGDTLKIRLLGLHHIERKSGEKYPAYVRIKVKQPLILFGRIVYSGKSKRRCQFRTNKKHGTWTSDKRGLPARDGGGLSFMFHQARIFGVPGPVPATVHVSVFNKLGVLW